MSKEVEVVNPQEHKEEIERRLQEVRQQIDAIPKGAGKIPNSTSNQDGESVLKIWAKQREIARLAALGYKEQEICRALGLSTSCVWQALNRNPLVQERILVLQGERDASTANVRAKIKALQPIAIEVLEETMLDPGTGRRLKVDVAKTVLDRGGNSAIQKKAVSHAIFTSEDLKEIQRRTAMLRGESPEEIEYEETD